MKKYPWDFDKEIDFSQEWPQITKQYHERLFGVVDKFIDHYFMAKLVTCACYTGWIVAAILGYCLVVVTK